MRMTDIRLGNISFQRFELRALTRRGSKRLRRAPRIQAPLAIALIIADVDWHQLDERGEQLGQ